MPLTRIAWFSPLAPVRSGISAYSAELLPFLAEDYAIDVFVDAPASARPLEVTQAMPGRVAGGIDVFSAHAFVSRQALRPYDLVVYQVGNAVCHDYMWPYLLRYPGLVVLHDAVLHHARAHALLKRQARADYRAEFAYAHPAAPADVAEFAVAGFSGSPYYLWPLRRIVIEAARLVAVHAEPVADLLRLEHPAATIRVIRMGVPAGLDGPAEHLGPVLACFGRVTPEKRIEAVLRAFAAVAAAAPSARLLLVGEVADYFDVAEAIARLDLGSQVTVTGFVDDHDLAHLIASADICLCLRWPTALETSASWLRCLAAGKTTVVTDLLQTADVPLLDPRTWTLAHTGHHKDADQTADGASGPVAVAIDVLEEGHSLALALERLMSDRELRRRLGANARRWWRDHHTLEHMADDYRRVIGAALATPGPPPHAPWPAHLTADGTQRLTPTLAELGLDALDVWNERLVP